MLKSTVQKSGDGLSTSGPGTQIWKESIQGRFITGHSVEGGPVFIPMKAVQWCFEAKNSMTSQLWKSPSTLLNVIQPNNSNSDSDTSNFTGVVMINRMYSPFYRHCSHKGSSVVFSSVITVSGAFVT